MPKGSRTPFKGALMRIDISSMRKAEPVNAAQRPSTPTGGKRSSTTLGLAAVPSDVVVPPKVARKDAPVRLGYTRGSRTAAVATARDPAALAAAVSVYDSRIHANSAAVPRDSLWETWQDIHCAAFGVDPGCLPVLPLTCDSIRTVVASMMASGYRSVDDYLA